MGFNEIQFWYIKKGVLEFVNEQHFFIDSHIILVVK